MFYSRYLKDEKNKAWSNGGGAPKAPKASSGGYASTARRRLASARAKPSALVWHSGTGASGLGAKAQSKFKPLGYKSDGKRKKVVHFSTIEVQPFHFDWELAKDVFYTRAELTAMGQGRFDDAATLRAQRELDASGRRPRDDARFSAKKSADRDLADLLATALGDEDRDDTVSIRGIEHFVYPELQQEMIRRKKMVQKEVMEFVRSKRPDPQGWRLAEHSRKFSLWARNVATEKGMRHAVNNAATDKDVEITEEEADRLRDGIDLSQHSMPSLRLTSSFGDAKIQVARGEPLPEICEVGKKGGIPGGSSDTEQRAGVSTCEG